MVDTTGINLLNCKRYSLTTHLNSLLLRAKNETPTHYIPMEFIIEEPIITAPSMTTEVLKNNVKQKLLEAFRFEGVQNAHQHFQVIEDDTLIMNFYVNTSSKVKNLAFLVAAYLGKLKYMQLLHELDAEIEFSLETGKFNALHLSALSGSLECCEWLLSMGCNKGLQQETIEELLPIDHAALCNSKDILQLFVKHGSKLPPTLINSAVRADAIDCVEYLLTLPLRLNDFDKDGMTPLHIAVDLGSLDCVKILLNSPFCNVNLPTNDGKRNTAVHLAAENGHDQFIKMLCEKHAKLNEPNKNNETPLHLACKSQYLDCVNTLLQNSVDVNARNNDQRTPLHYAVASSRLALPIVEKLIEWKADVNAADWYGFTPLHIAASNEQSECVDCLIMNGANLAAKTTSGISALKIIRRKLPWCLNSISKKLNSSLAYNTEQSLKFNFRDILTNSPVGEIGFLYALQKGGLPTILEHPICGAFLYLKWKKVRPYYLVRVVISILTIILLSSFVISVSTQNHCDHMINENKKNQTPGNITVMCNVSHHFRYEENIFFSMKITTFGLLITNVIRIIFSLSAYKSIRHYIFKLYNISELVVTVSFTILCFTIDDKDPPQPWQTVLGAITILFGWVLLMMMIGQMPSFGAYFSMFGKVLQEFSKLLLAFSCLLIGFTITLCVLFFNNDGFIDPLIGFLTVMSMMTGEINVGELMHSASEMKLAALIVLALFIIFVTIALMNLLVGLAVHDIEGLHKTANLNKLIHQTQLIYYLELACFNGLFPRKMSNIFRKFLYVWPDAYRVAIYVKPLNSEEKRLPKNIMEGGLKLALDKLKARKKVQPEQSLENRIDSLEKTIQQMKYLLVQFTDNNSRDQNQTIN